MRNVIIIDIIVNMIVFINAGVCNGFEIRRKCYVLRPSIPGRIESNLVLILGIDVVDNIILS